MPTTADGIRYDHAPGDGTPVIYVHGWLGSAASWDAVRNEMTVEHPAVVYDQRCHGDSACTPFDRIDQLVDDLAAVVDDAGIAAPVLAAHSMGGMVALQYAATRPVAGLFLVGTCADTPSPAVRSPRWFLDRFGEMDRAEWAELVVDNYTADCTPHEVVDAARQQLRDADDVPVESGLRAMDRFDVRDDLDAVEAPVTVVGGRHDRAITPEKVAELAALLGVDPVMLDAAHDMLHEVPAQVSDRLDSFLRTVG